MNPLFKALKDAEAELREALLADLKEIPKSTWRPRAPLTESSLNEILNLSPASRAIERLINSVPVTPTPTRSYNPLLASLNLVYAISGSIGARRGIALIIDDDIGEEYDKLIEVTETIGARVTCEYLKRGRDICGGRIPSDEVERAELSMQFEERLSQLDRKYRSKLPEEAERCFIEYLRRDIARNLPLLNQRSKKRSPTKR
jgi:hypothetical protein